MFSIWISSLDCSIWLFFLLVFLQSSVLAKIVAFFYDVIVVQKKFQSRRKVNFQGVGLLLSSHSFPNITFIPTADHLPTNFKNLVHQSLPIVAMLCKKLGAFVVYSLSFNLAALNWPKEQSTFI